MREPTGSPGPMPLLSALVLLMLGACASPPDVPLPPPAPKPSNQAQTIAAPNRNGGIDILITLPRTALARFSSREEELMVGLDSPMDLSALRTLPRRFPGCLRLVQTGADWVLLRAHPGLSFETDQQYRQITIRLQPSPTGAACAP